MELALLGAPGEDGARVDAAAQVRRVFRVLYLSAVGKEEPEWITPVSISSGLVLWLMIGLGESQEGGSALEEQQYDFPTIVTSARRLHL